MSHIFISYSHKDTEYAHTPAGKLHSEGFEVWIDARLDYGSQWPLEIQKNLDSCGAFILIMSPRSYASEWVQSELSRAKRKNKPIFPLLLEGDEPWLSVESTQYFDVRGEKTPDNKFYDALGRATTRLGKQPKNQSPLNDSSKRSKATPVPSAKRGIGIIAAGFGGMAILILFGVIVLWTMLKTDPPTSPTLPPMIETATNTSLSFTPTNTLPAPTQAVAPNISNFQACPSICNGQNSTNNFAAGITKIYFQFNYENFKSGIPYTRTWTMGGREWIRYTCAWDGSESGIEQLKLTEPKGLASGTWELKVTVDNVVLLDEDIVVVGNGNYWDPAGTINSCHSTN